MCGCIFEWPSVEYQFVLIIGLKNQFSIFLRVMVLHRFHEMPHGDFSICIYIHIILIVIFSGVPYHVEWMRSYHWITQEAKRPGSSHGMVSSTRSICYYNNMFIIYLFSEIFRILSIVLVFNPEKIVGTFALTLSFDNTSSCFPSLVPCLKLSLCNVTPKTGNQRLPCLKG